MGVSESSDVPLQPTSRSPVRASERMAAVYPSDAATLRHSGSCLTAWCVANLKIEPTATAIRATKQNAGDAKIDVAMALFNAAALMTANPEPPANANLAGFLADPLFG